MTKQQEILNDNNYIPIHNDGFIGLVDVMGTDETVERSARVSYAKGTRKVSDTRNLIRYLLRNKHTSPFEMCECMFHCRLPIFVARQWIRHRTANVNEASLRYSEAEDSFYIPNESYVCLQSTSNKQGRGKAIEELDAQEFVDLLKDGNTESYATYKENLECGIARELARIDLPVSLYTEWYWKCDLHNIMNFLKLRLHPHAQLEIQDYAKAMYSLVKTKFPICIEAFDDYVLNSTNFSKQELEILSHIINPNINYFELAKTKQFNLSKREFDEFIDKVKTFMPSINTGPIITNKE